jgi:two-component sensor histidine kinase
MRDQVAILAREAEHRSRNLLSSVQAIVNLSQADTVSEFKREVSGRIQALSNVLSLFTGSRWTGADLSSIVEQELAPFSDKVEGQVTMGGTPVLLEPDAAQAGALIVHELATNAAKYGALSVPAGHVDVAWSREDSGRLRLIWTETNGPPVQKPTRRGFGQRIIDALIRQQKGEVQFDWRQEGLICEITFQA